MKLFKQIIIVQFKLKFQPFYGTNNYAFIIHRIYFMVLKEKQIHITRSFESTTLSSSNTTIFINKILFKFNLNNLI